MVNFVAAVAYQFCPCLALPAAFMQPGARLLAEPSIRMRKMRTPIAEVDKARPVERYEGRAGDALVRIHGALHDWKKGEGEREWTWEPRHAVTGKSQPRRRKKSWAHVRTRTGSCFPGRPALPFLPPSLPPGRGRGVEQPDEMTVPGREMDRIMG